MLTWPDFFMDPINLKNIGAAFESIPLADCTNCRYKQSENATNHCYMFKQTPGSRCGQFQLRKTNDN